MQGCAQVPLPRIDLWLSWSPPLCQCWFHLFDIKLQKKIKPNLIYKYIDTWCWKLWCKADYHNAFKSDAWIKQQKISSGTFCTSTYILPTHFLYATIHINQLVSCFHLLKFVQWKFWFTCILDVNAHNIQNQELQCWSDNYLLHSQFIWKYIIDLKFILSGISNLCYLSITWNIIYNVTENMNLWIWIRIGTDHWKFLLSLIFQPYFIFPHNYTM